MSFLETVERARAFLERNGRVSLRALQREFSPLHPKRTLPRAEPAGADLTERRSWTFAARGPSGSRKPQAALQVLTCAVAAWASWGCVQIRVDYQTLDHARLRGVEVGVTTRGEVLESLGPPEEFRQPAMGEQARRLDRRKQRALEEHEVFRHPSWTYATERLSADVFGILPVVAVLFRITRSRSVQEQWWIEFDEAGVVRLIAHTDEIEDP